MPHRIYPLLVGILVMLTCAICRADQGVVPQGSYLTFGVVPRYTIDEIAERWTPLLKRISDETGIPIHLRSEKDNTEFVRAIQEGRYDFIYSNPLQFARYGIRAHYHAVLRHSDPLIGIIVVPQDSPIHDITQLAGKTMLMPSREAFAARILVISILMRQGISVREEYMNSHSAVYRDVSSHLADAGGGVLYTFQLMDKNTQTSLRILMRAPPVPSLPIAYNARVPSHVVDEVIGAFRRLARTLDGRHLLQNVSLDPLIDCRDRDYKALDAMTR
jgi:phosphonate transport system substrate-binding protein